MVADYLSRTFNLTQTDLTNSVHRLFPSQIPKTFRVCQLPPEIISWISLVAPQRPASFSERSNPVTNQATAHGEDGSSTYTSKVATPCTLLSHPLKRDGKTWTHRRDAKRPSILDTYATCGAKHVPRRHRIPPTPPRRRLHRLSSTRRPSPRTAQRPSTPPPFVQPTPTSSVADISTP